ncbi:MAG: hypothetical protein AAF943_01980 [Pseudomonadota bacterium]
MIKQISRAVLLSAVMATLPLTAWADGHTGAFPGNKGFVGHVSQPRPVTNQHSHSSKFSHRTRLAVRAFCPPHFYGMYRGTTYCQNGVALPN